MSTPDKHVEETKIVVPKSDVSVSKEGHVTIKNPRLVEKLKALNVGDHARGVEAADGVGVIVSKSF